MKKKSEIRTYVIVGIIVMSLIIPGALMAIMPVLVGIFYGALIALVDNSLPQLPILITMIVVYFVFSTVIGIPMTYLYFRKRK